jgi:hypothetical protein
MNSQMFLVLAACVVSGFSLSLPVIKVGKAIGFIRA